MENPFRLIERTDIYHDAFIALHKDLVRLPEGVQRHFSWIWLRGGSLVLALDRDRQIYLVREYKYAKRIASFELIGGGIDDGEDPLEAARRELREEAGVTADTWRSLGVVHPTPSHVDCTIHLYLATDLAVTARTPDVGEVLEVHKVPLAQAVEMVLHDEITHAPSCALILKAHLLHQWNPDSEK